MKKFLSLCHREARKAVAIPRKKCLFGIALSSALVGLLAMTLIFGSACSKMVKEKAPLPDMLVWENFAEPPSLDPGLSSDDASANVITQLFEGLAEYDPKTLAPVPGVATRWEVSPDGLTYTFYLRGNAKWSNGDPVTASDFEYSWKRVLDPATAAQYAYILYFVQNAEEYNTGKIRDPKSVGVKALSPTRLQVTLKEPTPFFPSLTCFHAYRPVHKATVEKFGNQWTKAENMVGNGAYKMVTWVPMKEIILKKNQNYWDAANVRIVNIKFLPTEDQETALKQYLSGFSHFIRFMPYLQIPEMSKRPDFHSGAQLVTYYYQFNTHRKPFDDPRVRRALNMGIDRKRITDLLQKGDVPTNHLTPKMAGYNPPEGPDFSPEAAKKLLAEAGFTDPKTFPSFSIIYNTDQNHKAVAEMIQNMWKKNLGIEATLQNVDWKVLIDTYQKTKEFSVGRTGWVGDYIDPYAFVSLFTSTSTQNNTGWSDPTFDNLVLNQIPKELNLKNRADMMQKAEAILLEASPIIPIFHYGSSMLIDTRLKSFYPNVQNIHPAKFAYFKEEN